MSPKFYTRLMSLYNLNIGLCQLIKYRYYNLHNIVFAFDKLEMNNYVYSAFLYSSSKYMYILYILK